MKTIFVLGSAHLSQLNTPSPLTKGGKFEVHTQYHTIFVTHAHTPLPGPAFKVRTQYTHVSIVCSSRHSKRGQVCV